MAVARLGRVQGTDESHTVTTLELFFDLVFVFALTQVTALLADDPTARGAVRGVLVLAILWWAWTGFVWIGNLVHADEGVVRVVLVVVMGATLVMSMAIPEAFTDGGGAGLFGPLVFAGAYLAVRALHLALFAVVGRDDPALLATLARFALPFAVGTAALVAASFTSGTLQTVLWALALGLDYSLVWLIGPGGWRVNSAGHFAERHGLVVIIALGESIVAIGVGAQGLPLSWPVVVAATLALTVLVSLWWMYFDVVALVAERRFAAARGAERVAIARDSYSYLHFPMVAGIVFLALGMKKVLGYVADSEHGGWLDGKGLHGMPLWSLYGGVVVYLAAHVAFRLRNIGSLNRQRVALAVLLMALVPAVGHLSPMGQLAVLAGLVVTLVCYETFAFRPWREKIRHAPAEH
jgi:low temperature requirement protein LtrA